MEDPVAAVAESIVDYIRKEDIEGLIRNLNMSDGEWRQELRYEFDLEKMLEAIFRFDILIPKLIMCDIQTISPFHYAALRGVDVILERFVLQHQIPIDMCLRSGSTALHFACFAGMLDTVALLVERFHADINRRDRYGWTPLHYASTEGNLHVVEYLVSKGADISARDKDGTTAAFRAQAYGHVSIVSYFVQSSGDEDLLLVDDTASDQTSLCDEQEIYATLEAMREKKSNAGKFNNSAGENASNPSEHQIALTDTDGCGKQKVASLVRDQLNDLLAGNPDPYMNPVSDSGSRGGEKVNLDIGLKTLTRILSNELLKFKTDHEIKKIEDSKQDSTNVNNSKQRSSTSDYEEISKFSKIQATSENVTSQISPTSNSCDYDEAVPVDPPPLPPRSNSIIEVKEERQAMNVSKKKSGSKNSKSKKKRLDRINYMTLSLADVAKEYPAKTKALVILNRFDHSGTVMEACFQAVVRNMGDVENWKRLCTELPLRRRPDAVKRCIRNIEMRHPADPPNQALSALQDWRYYFGEAANVDALIEAMKRCGLDDKVPIVELAAQEFTA